MGHVRVAVGLAGAFLALAGCASGGGQPIADSAPTVQQDARLPELAAAKGKVQRFFGRPIPRPFRLDVAPNRAAFDAALPAAWGIAPTQCWMVGVGVADGLYLLSPAVWKREACEHDGANSSEVAGIVTHELVHVFHGQMNPTGDFTGMDDLGWFVEGLAVLVAGQMDDPGRPSAADAIAAGAAPVSLSKAWSGPHRYGVSGSLVAYIDARYGRSTLTQLLSATTQDELLRRLGTSEGALLNDWKAWVLAGQKR